MKSLTTLTMLFYFTATKNEVSDYPHYPVLVITIKIKSLTTLTRLVYFTTTKMKFLTTLTTLTALVITIKLTHFSEK